MADSKDLKKKVAANLRSVTQSSKGGVPFESLDRDYRDLVGVSIPYRKLGYSSLEAMIRAMPDVVRLQRNAAGKSVVMAVADEATAHIASLIARQKGAVRRPTRPRRTERVRRAPVASRTSVRHFNKGTRAPPPYVEADYQTHSSSSNDDHFHEVTRTVPSVPLHTSEQIPISKSRVAPPATFGPKYEVPPRFLRKQERPLSSLENNSTEDRFSSSSDTPAFSYNTRQATLAGSTVTYPSPDAYFVPPPTRRPERTAYEAEPTSMVEVIENYAKRKNLIACFRTLPFEDYYMATLTLGDRKFRSRSSSSDESAAKENCAASAVEVLQLKGSAREFVENYARKNNLNHSYHTAPIGQKRKSFVSVLTLGDQKYRIYPDVKPTPEDAEEAAAERAREEIKKSEVLKKMLPVARMDDLDSQNIMLTRIEQMVVEKPQGIWNNSIPTEYEQKYHERLPEGWFELVTKACTFYFEKVDGHRVILYPGSGRCVSPTSTISSQEEDGIDDLERKFSKFSYDEPLLEMPTSDHFDVFVCSVHDAQCISVRLVDYAERFAELSENMKVFYEKNKYPVSNLVPDTIYAVSLSGLWHRATTLEDVNGDMVTCYLLDEGDFAEVHVSCFQEMDCSFLELPVQAVNFGLSELDCYAVFVKPETLKYYLLGKVLVAKIVDSARNLITLYDTSTDEDIILNRIIFEKTVAESLNYTLPESGSTAMAYLSHVSPCGTVYLTFNSPSTTNLLLEELCRITPICEEAAKLGCDISKTCVYCAKYDADSIWYRAVILNVNKTKDEVEVLYIDYGNTSWVSVSSICELEPISEYLSALPFQAVRCTLSELPPRNLFWSDKATQKLGELVAYDRELIVRVQRPGTEKELPQVSLFIRNSQSQIVSINQTLAFDEQLFSPTPSVKRDRLPSWTGDFFSEFNKTNYKPLPSSPHRGHVACSSPLLVENATNDQQNLSNFIPDVAVSAEQQRAKRNGNCAVTCPAIGNECDSEAEQFPPLYPTDVPEEGNFFDIFVTMAASPFNFMCQPLKSSKELDQLFSEMQSFYSNEENLCEMHSVLVRKGEFFAGKHIDGSWYRVRKQSIVSEDPLQVSVYYVDYGDICILPLPNLQPLFKQFKTLPCQCMKASLKGVRPNGHDWDPMGCYEFKKMVEEKQFVSIVESKKLQVEDHLTVYSLELILIDVSDPNVDVMIHEELIKNKIAEAQPTK